MRIGFKNTLLALLCCLLAYGAYLYTLDADDMPPLKDGDLIFQTSWTDQSLAIGLATASPYIHGGIIRQAGSGFVVIEAAATVKETPLREWIGRGILGRFALYRHRDLNPGLASRLLEAAKAYYGRLYDHYFSFDNDTIYCSELIYLAFKDAGIAVDAPEKIAALYINNAMTKKLIEQRWEQYPSCKGKGFSFEQCYDVIMEQEIISPERIATDSHIERIFTNYP